MPNAFEPVEPSRVIIVEGILALHYDELLPLYDFSIYVDAPNQICLKRRIYRDMRERGRTEECVRAQFEATAKPMADLYVLPSQTRATMTVLGTDALDWSIEQIFRELRTHARLFMRSTVNRRISIFRTIEVHCRVDCVRNMLFVIWITVCSCIPASMKPTIDLPI